MRTLLVAALAAAVSFCPLAASAQAKLTWTANSTPAVSTQATASRAANANQIHVATSCSGSIATVAAQTAITLSLRNGATGAGTVLWSQTTSCPIGAQCLVTSPPMNSPGSLGVAMTCEWSGAPVTTNFAVANLVGYDLQSQ
jgi:hypothetical protein